MCVNATKLAAENAFNGDHFPFIGNKYQNVRKETYLRIPFQDHYAYFNETKAATKKTYNQDFFAFEGNSK